MEDGITTLPWPCFQYGQEDLEARSREPVIYEREYFHFNHLYSGAETLRQYAGLPEGRPVPWAMQTVIRYVDPPTGHSALSGEMPDGVRKIRDSHMPLVFPIDEVRAAELRRVGVEGVSEIGATFHYARKLYRRKGMESAPIKRRGTIALPDKSDLGKLVDFDREAYAKKLAALPEEFHPVYVSMHWRDYERGCHEPYLKAGLTMVCAGHPHDPLFYERLYDTFRHFTYSCSNEISSSFGLSVLSGCRFFFLDGGNVTIQRANGVFYEGAEPTLDLPEKKVCVEASPYPPNDDGGSLQRELAARYSGEHLVKSPEFFRDRWKEGLDALSSRVNESDLILDCEERYREFMNWLPYGFDRDGWAEMDCGLELPARSVQDRIEITLTGAKTYEADRIVRGSRCWGN